MRVKKFWFFFIFITISLLSLRYVYIHRKLSVFVSFPPPPPPLEYSVLRTGPLDIAKVFGRAKGCEDTTPEFILQISKTAFKYHQNPKILAAVIAVESKCDSLAISGRGAVGLMQVMPRIWKNQFDFTKKNLFNPEDNLEVGTKILADLIDKYGVPDGLRRYQGVGVGCDSCDGFYVQKILKLAEGK